MNNHVLILLASLVIIFISGYIFIKTILVYKRYQDKIQDKQLLLTECILENDRIQLTWINLSDLLEAIVEVTREQATKSEVNIHAVIEEGIALKGDESLLLYFYNALIKNALANGKDTRCIEIALFKENRGTNQECLVGYVSNDGENQTKKKSQQNQNKLCILKEIANLHHGDVWWVSEFGIGNTFFYRFIPNR
ncbi:hypothetical protein [Anaerosporobacter sp.]|uniref:hypothetical protein n=1 Tax=Anaerosporobacter sp. TaxID=1872529 RepID=UPI00286F11A2|nr:hypothetical protein [Anaerosporobacter sp.]